MENGNAKDAIELLGEARNRIFDVLVLLKYLDLGGLPLL